MSYLKSLRQKNREFRRYLASKIAPTQYSVGDKNKVDLFEKKLASTTSVEILLAQAEAATQQNFNREAVRALRFAIRLDAARVEGFCLKHSSIALRQNYFLAMANLKFKENPRIFQLFQPCALLERFQPQLSSLQRETIQRLLEARRNAWESQATPSPRYHDVYHEAVSQDNPGGHLVIIMPKYVGCDPTGLDNDISYYVQRSAVEAGLKVDRFDSDHLTYKKSAKASQQMQQLENFLDEKRPDLIVFDGNYLPQEGMLDAQILLRLKQRFNFRAISIIGDLYDHLRLDFLSYWAQVSDLSVIFHRYTWFYDSFPQKEKVLVCPTLPYCESFFRGGAQDGRDLGLTYIGSGTRNRKLYMDVAHHSGLQVSSHIHNRLLKGGPDFSAMADIYGRSKIIFNNGWNDEGEAILTGRMGETILSGALLLQEYGAPIDDYLVPFVHYVPFANMHQFIAMAQFFLSEEEWRKKIATDAYHFWRKYYSSSLFWTTALERLNLSKIQVP